MSCVHGGIPRYAFDGDTINFVDKLRSQELPLQTQHAAVFEILWNDPHENDNWGRNIIRGRGAFLYGKVNHFIIRNTSLTAHLHTNSN